MPIDYQSTQIVAVADWDLPGQETRISRRSVFESSRYALMEIAYGYTTYPLKRMLLATYLRSREEFLVDGLNPEIVGHGKSAEEARDDFCLRFHSRFQDLLYKRPFEMTKTDLTVWKKIGAVVDVTVYRNQTPIVVEQYGIVSHGRLAYPCKIKWDNGYTEAIDIRKVACPDFVNYRPGQPIKALVRRNPITREIIDIQHVKKVASLPTLAELSSSAFVEQVLNSEPFPCVGWD